MLRCCGHLQVGAETAKLLFDEHIEKLKKKAKEEEEDGGSKKKKRSSRYSSHLYLWLALVQCASWGLGNGSVR